MMLRSSIFTTFLLGCYTLGVAQEPAPKWPAELLHFQAVYHEYALVNSQTSELEQRLTDETDADANAKLREQIQIAAKQSEQLLPRLRDAAIAAYGATPNEYDIISLTLVGLIRLDYQNDNYESGMTLVRLMEKKNYKNPYFDVLAGAIAYRLNDYETAEPYLQKGLKAGKLDADAQQMLASFPDQKRYWSTEQRIREREAAADDLPRVKLETTKGTIVIELFENEAPQTVANFVNLVENRFYDGLTFHRVLSGFVAQGGDPKGDGKGGPGYEIYCECRNRDDFRRHFRGSLSMAHAGPDTGGSQFFLAYSPISHLDGRHTVFGRVIEGLDVLAKLQRRDPNSPVAAEPDKIVKAEVLRKRDHKYEPTKVSK